ncbi:MAG: hypothetical protein JRH15_10555 [Deltaproteobacteria bacterium]|nr:hypothetical protein [Deltaproteobacteria bacterium]
MSQAITNNNDLATVETGGAAYLLMIDGLLVNDPANESLLITASKLYSQYATAFVTEPERARRLTQKAFEYARQALCIRRSNACDMKTIHFEAFTVIIDRMDRQDLPALYALGAAWASFIQVRQDDWQAIGEIPRVQFIMERVLVLDGAFDDGGPHIYLGVFASLIPPAAGGKPEEGRKHFEQAILLSGNQNLMIHVLYAQFYARLVFDRDLHDKLLNEVIDADPDVTGYVLVNMSAQRQARVLLESANDYF